MCRNADEEQRSIPGSLPDAIHGPP